MQGFWHWWLVNDSVEQSGKGELGMTQHRWKTLDGWEVLTGWDRMGASIAPNAAHYFLGISRANADAESGEGVLFDNLSDETGMTDQLGGMRLVQVTEVCDRLLTEVPPGVFDAMLQDEIHNRGNDHTYETVGRVK
jgi:hypothetical protein